MSDATTLVNILDGPRHFETWMTNVSDGTGESNVVKVDRSALAPDGYGVSCSRLTVDVIEYDVSGFDYVKLSYDETTDQNIAVLKGSGTFVIPGGDASKNTGGEGDILLTTSGSTSGNSYTILLIGRKKFKAPT